jgi:hypothetical protein
MKIPKSLPLHEIEDNTMPESTPPALEPRGNKAKPYQVKQVRNVILKYRMGGELNVKAEV